MSSKQELSLSVNVNGQSKVPPGFRFHPTEEELLHYYLRKKVMYESIDLDVIRDVDLNKLEPWDIKEKCRIGSTPQNDWYFFSHKDKKYPTGTRTNRATAAGFWKATGRDKVIYSRFKRLGMRKTLVFYRGRAPHGQKSDWIMHEYRLDDNMINYQDYGLGSNFCDSTQEDGWVVCRVFKKRNYDKSVERSSLERSSSAPSTDDWTTKTQSLKKDEQNPTLAYINSPKPKQETESPVTMITTTRDFDLAHQFTNPINDSFLHLPQLHTQSSELISTTIFDQDQDSVFSTNHELHLENWSDVDRLVASQLNGQQRSSNQTSEEYICFPLLHYDDQEPLQPLFMGKPYESKYTSEIDIWRFAQSASQSSSPDPIYHLSV